MKRNERTGEDKLDTEELKRYDSEQSLQLNYWLVGPKIPPKQRLSLIHKKIIKDQLIHLATFTYS